jgi:hypothetical protein
LKAAASALHEKNRRVMRAEEDAVREAELAEWEAETAWMREPGRIIVGGHSKGWIMWERRPAGGWRNTRQIVLGSVSLEPYDPHLVDIFDDVIGLYSIQDPRGT